MRAAGGLDWKLDVEALERARILHGWTRRELAQRAKVDEGTLGDLLARRRRPTFGTIRAIIRSLGLALGDVIQFQAGTERVPARPASK
jgi:transcriptional regulator with XRE-family HTH domain